MPQARLQVTLPEGTWIGDLSRSYSDATFRVLASLPAEDRGVGLVEIRTAEPETIVEEMRDHEGTLMVDIQALAEDRALVRFETDEPLLLLSAGAAGVPIEPPVTISGGRASVSVTAPRDRLSRLTSQLEAFGMQHDLRVIREATGPGDLLTDRQQTFLEAAAEHGYYEVPRDCTLTELADELDVAKSTASEVLARAEAKVVRNYLLDSGQMEPRV